MPKPTTIAPMPASLLSLTVLSGFGCRSIPAGAWMFCTPGAEKGSSFGFTDDLHFLGFFARSKHQLGAIK
jgi:hypothetical protein